MSPFWSKKHDFWGPFWHSFFIIFVNDQKLWNRWQFYTFTSFWLSKTSHFPTKISLFFHVLSKPLPRTVFRGSRCRSLLKTWILVSFSIFGISRKVIFGHHFRQKCHRRLWLNPAGTVLEPIFSEHFCFAFLIAFGLHFGSFWLPFGILLAPCWSIWLHFDDLKPTLHPTTPNLFVKLIFIVI